MAGHSKWANIKHRKSAVDAKRGKVFTKLIKELTVAARAGGGDPNANPRLRTAIADAKSQNMPKDNVERAIKKGTGELEGTSYEEISYEGYGPGGAAVLIESLTDNKNRTAADIRHILSKNGGNLGENGCVAWIFEKKGYIVIEKETTNEDRLMESTLEAGAEDVREDEDNFEVITGAGEFENVKEVIDKEKFAYILAEVTMLPSNYTPLNEADAEKMIKLMDALEDCDDVQKVYTNADI
ncbi:MAG: YebC/PmpR family DNA-binding transcriptional regulator [Deltaproteobacteria bacterium]|nr:YebC/PmpR family DNA-binding transcriptional regulator [Deltaproteobacteria bacterium]